MHRSRERCAAGQRSVHIILILRWARAGVDECNQARHRLVHLEGRCFGRREVADAVRVVRVFLQKFDEICVAQILSARGLGPLAPDPERNLPCQRRRRSWGRAARAACRSAHGCGARHRRYRWAEPNSGRSAGTSLRRGRGWAGAQRRSSGTPRARGAALRERSPATNVSGAKVIGRDASQ